MFDYWGVVVGVGGFPTQRLRRVHVNFHPGPDESLPSWLRRFAAKLRIPEGFLAEHLGMASLSSLSGKFRPTHFGVTFDRATSDALRITTGLGPERFEPCLLKRFDGTFLDLAGLDAERSATLRPVAMLAWADFQGSRICPTCILENAGVWETWWRLSLAAVCPTHQTMMSDRCPRCGLGWGRGTSLPSSGLSRKFLPRLDQCTNLHGGGLCGMPFDEVGTVEAPHAVIEAQQRLFDWVHNPHLAGEPVTGPCHVVSILCGIVRVGADIERFAGAGTTLIDMFVRDDLGRFRPSTPATPARTIAPPTAATAACLQVAVADLLAADTPDRFREVISDLAVIRGHEGRNLMGKIRLPGTAGQIWLEEQTRTSRLSARSRRHAVSIGLEHIPHLVPEDLYDTHVAGLLPGTARPTGRRFAAFAAARIAGAPSWPQAIRAIEAPFHHLRICDVVARRVQHPDRFWEAVRQVTVELAERSIDFAARRRQAATFVHLPKAVWAHICRTRGLVNTVTSARNAAVWLWADWTSGHWADAPAICSDSTLNMESAREMYRRFVRRVPPEVFTDLRGWALSTWESQP